MKLTEKQQEFLELALKGDNIYLSGRAGTGKSSVVREFLKLTDKEVVCLGTTGVAAINIQGETLHSFFGLQFGKIFEYSEVTRIPYPKISVVKEAQVIIIDEVSMLRSDVLEMVKITMIKSRIPVHNKQFIFVGDLLQLPPVVTEEEEQKLTELYGGVEFHHSNFYKDLNVKIVDLKEIVRQSDQEFIDNLNLIREGKKAPYFRQFITDTPSGIILAPHNATVDYYNKKGLDALTTPEEKFYYEEQGLGNLKDFGIESPLILKKGAKIMYTVNDPNRGLVNGTLGTYEERKVWTTKPEKDPKTNKIKRVAIFEKRPCIVLQDGTALEIKNFTFEKHKYVMENGKIEKKVVGAVTGFPVKLAFALTIHKSQGLTFEEMTLDLSKPCFQKGQLYTALSRVKSPEGLKIIHKK